MRRFSRGDFVIYQEVRAQSDLMTGDANGESITIVEHKMTVCDFSKKGTLVLQTHEGHMHVTHSDDPNLRRASLWQRWFSGDRFPRLKQTTRSGSLRVST